MAAFVRETALGVELLLLVQPRASRTRLVGEHDGRLKVQVASPPVDGAANAALLEFLSEQLHLPKRELSVATGETGRRKTVLARGARAADVVAALGVAP